MSRSILYCGHCKQYTMRSVCSSCGEPTGTTRPAKFSPEDRWGKYRREAKREAENL